MNGRLQLHNNSFPLHWSGRQIAVAKSQGPIPATGTAKTIYWLRFAERGVATFATNLMLTRLGNMGYWELEDTGRMQPVTPYVMQGGFDVTEWPIYRSRLTDKGRDLLG